VSFDRVVVAVTASRRDFGPTLVALRALGLGDLLTAVPAWRALERHFRGYRRFLATPRSLAPLVRMLGAEHLAADGLSPLPETPVSRERSITVAVNLHGCGPESDVILLERQPSTLIAFKNPEVPATGSGPPWEHREHEVDRWCRLLAAYGIPADRRDIELGPRDGIGARPASVPAAAGVSTTVIHPGAGAAARRWPPSRFAAVARAEQANGHRVVVTGTKDERVLAERVAAGAAIPRDCVLAGRTDVEQLVDVVAQAGRIVSGDTGIAHLATALRTPSVVLFGPTSPATWGPPPDRPWHRVLWAGRTGDPHGRAIDSGLLEISVRDVLDALATLPRPPEDRRVPAA
jgi:hypothetical protein